MIKDRDWFIIFLQDQIQEEETNAWRYKTEDQYERVAKLKRIYNILSHKKTNSFSLYCRRRNRTNDLYGIYTHTPSQSCTLDATNV